MDEPTDRGSFGAKVRDAVAATGPLCAGIDPSVALLEQWGLDRDAGGLLQFGLRCVESFAGLVPVVKPQVAFFEQFGSGGMVALEMVIVEARSAGLLVIADAKRGDIGNTMEAYASAWLDPDSTLAADAVTALPYLGLGSLDPMIELAAAHGRGVIVVVRSSNPEGRALQEARTGGGTGPAVEDLLLAAIAERNHGGQIPQGTIGAVVGATLGPSEFDLGGLGGVILAPGLGAQGAGVTELAALFAGCPPGSVLASASRSLLAAGPERSSLAAAAAKARDEIGGALATGPGIPVG
jgi:orotidine-5'-phosphate decarboxylase